MSRKFAICCAVLGGVVLNVAAIETATANAGAKRTQATNKIAQSYGCMLECRDKGWGASQCKSYCKWYEGAN